MMNPAFLKRMQDLLQEEYPHYVDALRQEPYRGIRINTLKISPNDFFFLTGFPENPTPFCRNGFYMPGGYHYKTMPAWHAGLFYSQEPSASAAVTALNPQPGMKVLDLCAAPGSKTTQIAEMLGNEGMLLANEINSKRAAILCENVSRHGAANVLVSNSRSVDIACDFPEFFDAVLVDAPCSGEGMMRKEEQEQYEWSEEAVDLCAQRQKEILDQAYLCLRPGGRMVYSTCTFSPQENEEQMAAFVNRYPDMHIQEIPAVFGRPGLDRGYGTASTRRIYPMDHGEGHFVCLLSKEENSPGVWKGNSEALPKKIREELNCILMDSFPYYHIEKDRIYGGTAPFYPTRKTRILQNQVFLGYWKNNRFEPAYPLFMQTAVSIRLRAELNDEHALHYLHGEEIAMNAEKGYGAACWHGHALGGVKSDGKGRLKNHLPKNLRI